MREAPVREHTFGDKTIPSDLFGTNEAKNLSAVVWCNQFTVPRFFRIAAEAEGLPDDVDSAVNWGWHATETESESDSPAERYRYCVGDRDLPSETWCRGVTVFRNPHANVALPEGALVCTSEFRLRQGRLVRDVHDFHPLTSFLRMEGR